MISTEILYGQGLGNQLACYVSTRAIAADRGVDFGIHDPHGCWGDKRYNDKGLYFMDLDMGKPIDVNKIELFYNEQEYRYFTNNNHHDATQGCWVNITDEKLKNIPDNSHILGIMQGPDYFYHRIEEVKQWLKVKPEYDNRDFCSDDICIMNVRANMDPWIYLSRNYWINAINHMLDINPNMSFLVITEDPISTKQLLPELADNIHDFGIGEDYAIIKNAKYLIVSNSSFSIFPSLTSETLKYVIAPKYMLRHNVSDGYWCQGYNIYPSYTYMDREGRLFTAEECIKEFNEYCNKNDFYNSKVVKRYSDFPNVATIKPKI
jgi:hypothetical protein